MRFNLRHNPARSTATALAVFACGLIAIYAAQPARAAEHITLANGFDVICHHHALVDGRVRVYLKAAEPENYFELSPDAIAMVETVPDPVPAPAAQTQTGPVREAPSASRSVSTPDPHLTRADLHQLLSKAGSEHNVDEDLLASVVKAESGGNTRAISRAGARGLMQLMPGTAQQLGVSDSFQPEENIRGGTSYLDGLLTRYHDNIALALAAYNAGPEAVDRYRGIPPFHETRAYVAYVIHEFNRRVAARRKLSRPATATASLATGSEHE